MAVAEQKVLRTPVRHLDGARVLRERPFMIMSPRCLILALLLSACAPPMVSVRMQNLPPVDGGIARGEATLPGLRGITLYEQWWRPATAPPRGAVAIVHGFKDHGDRYAELARHLVDKGLAVYAIDLRGHGRSSGRRAVFDHFDDNLADLDTFLADVRKREPNLPLFLFGHSIGGATVTLYTITRQPQLAGLIVHGGALKIDVSKAKIGGVKLVAALSPYAKVFKLDPKLFSHDPQVFAAAEADPFIYHPDHPARTAREALSAIARVEANGNQVRVPLLVIHGAADRVTPPAGSELLYKNALSLDKTLTLYPGFYHDLLRDLDHDKVVSEIVDWIAARLPAS
jgi:alpha-beta hydrolase superfamily lysophospholipase